MNMKCNGFTMFQLPDSRGNWNKVAESIEGWLDDYSRNGSGKQVFATIISNNRSDYSKFKGIFTRKSIMSQIILKQTARKMNLSVASNIMK
jgi:hypothetical protein